VVTVRTTYSKVRNSAFCQITLMHFMWWPFSIRDAYPISINGFVFTINTGFILCEVENEVWCIIIMNISFQRQCIRTNSLKFFVTKIVLYKIIYHCCFEFFCSYLKTVLVIKPGIYLSSRP
jgi:hypothetical protein